MLNHFRPKMRDPSDKRHGPRRRIFRPAILVCGRDAVGMHLLDVSKGGALAHGLCPRAPGEIVWLQSGGLEIRSRVVWVRGNRFGLAFGIRLTDANLKTITVAH